MSKSGFITGIKDWPYYLGGFLIVILPDWIFSYLSSEFGVGRFYSGNVGVYAFYATPLLLGLIIGTFFRSHLRPLSWGIFLGYFLFFNLLNVSAYNFSLGRNVMLPFLFSAGFVAAVCFGAGVAILFPVLAKKICSREVDRYVARVRKRKNKNAG